MVESLFQKKSTKWLESKGAYCRKQNASGLSRTGTPDYINCIEGVFLAIEYKKSMKDKPTELQKNNIKQINDANGIAIVLRPETFDTFKIIIEIFLLDRTENRIETLKNNLIKRVGIE
jgi:hypothetical protein